MHYIQHAEWSEIRVYTSKCFKRERYNAQFSSKLTNDSDLRVSGFVLTLESVCTTFSMQNGVKFAFKRGNILNGREITYN